VHLVGFSIRMYHDARSFECQIHNITSKMTQIKHLILKTTAAGYAVVLLPIFQTVRCQILQLSNINNIAV